MGIYTSEKFIKTSAIQEGNDFPYRGGSFFNRQLAESWVEALSWHIYIYIYMYIYIYPVVYTPPPCQQLIDYLIDWCCGFRLLFIMVLRLRPCRRPPWMQGAAGRLTAEMDRFYI